MSELSPLLEISRHIWALPVIHGSGECAQLVRRWLLENDFDCLAIPLPESFRAEVERGVIGLPTPSIVIQAPTRPPIESNNDDWLSDFSGDGFGSDNDDETDESIDHDDFDEDDDLLDFFAASYVPIDPCQPVIMGIRAAMGEHITRAYVDMEAEVYLPVSAVMPDPYALRTVSPERFAAAMLPNVPFPGNDQTRERIAHMAVKLRELEQHHNKILLICSVLEWPWIRQAYRDLTVAESPFADTAELGGQAPIVPAKEEESQREPWDEEDILWEPPKLHPIAPRSLMFLFGELPFITGLYERARAELEEDENLLIDGVKELLLAAREAYYADLKARARKITPFGVSQCLKYIRNLSLISRRMTPNLYTIVTAAKQIFGDQYALHVVETARTYPYLERNFDEPAVTMGIEEARLPDDRILPLVNRLPGPSVTWRSIELNRRPTEDERNRWRYRWNPYGMCSYPPEDILIERLRSRVFDRARAVMGTDLAKTEKFTTSVKDGIDIRDTVRHWYEKQIYVKVLPPSRGGLDACVMLFDSPADPRDYPWRSTWFAEHEDESTLAFFATDFTKEIIGPGICLATYGGAMFLYPPVPIPDIWTDRRIDFAETLEERLLAAACLHSRERQVALLSPLPPGNGWKRLARRFKKQLVHVPTAAFSEAQLSQLRLVHVLNGKKVRSYAEHFIRKA